MILRRLIWIALCFVFGCGADFQLDIDPAFTHDQREAIWTDVRAWDDMTCVPFEGHWKIVMAPIEGPAAATTIRSDHLIKVDMTKDKAYAWFPTVIAHELGHARRLQHVAHGVMQAEIEGPRPVFTADDFAECVAVGECCPF